ALKNKQLIMPSDTLMKEEFNKYVGSTASGNTANMTYSAYRSIYAHILERDNKYKSTPDVIDPDIAKTALGLATGGVYKQGVKFGGSDWKVSKPYGMTDDSFEAKTEQGYRTISKETGISVADLESLRLRRSDKRSAKGEIQYDLINERGNPLVVGGVAWRINMMGATK
ncbi:MAG: methyl-coenzyme M reductase, partial [Acinetobacter sp.]